MNSAYKDLVDQAVAALREVMRVDAAAIARTVSTAHAVGPVLDPTSYRNGMRSLDDQEAIAGAIQAAQRKVMASPVLFQLLHAADIAEGRPMWPCFENAAPSALDPEGAG